MNAFIKMISFVAFMGYLYCLGLRELIVVEWSIKNALYMPISMTISSELQYAFLSIFFATIATLISREVFSDGLEDQSDGRLNQKRTLLSLTITLIFLTALALIAKRIVDIT